MTPLFCACERGNATAIKALLEAGADPNVRNKVSTICVMWEYMWEYHHCGWLLVQ